MAEMEGEDASDYVRALQDQLDEVINPTELEALLLWKAGGDYDVLLIPLVDNSAIGMTAIKLSSTGIHELVALITSTVPPPIN